MVLEINQVQLQNELKDGLHLAQPSTKYGTNALADQEFSQGGSSQTQILRKTRQLPVFYIKMIKGTRAPCAPLNLPVEWIGLPCH